MMPRRKRWFDGKSRRTLSCYLPSKQRMVQTRDPDMLPALEGHHINQWREGPNFNDSRFCAWVDGRVGLHWDQIYSDLVREFRNTPAWRWVRPRFDHRDRVWGLGHCYFDENGVLRSPELDHYHRNQRTETKKALPARRLREHLKLRAKLNRAISSLPTPIPTRHALPNPPTWGPTPPTGTRRWVSGAYRLLVPMMFFCWR